MRAHQFLTEAPLTPANLFDPRHLKWRPQNFLKKLEAGTPFVYKEGNKYNRCKNPSYNRRYFAYQLVVVLNQKCSKYGYR